MKNLLYISFICLLLTQCKKEEVSTRKFIDEPYFLEIPTGFPVPKIPEDNKLTKYRVALGKKLFFDPILSEDLTISCGSCHFPNKAFSDTSNLSKGVYGRTGIRNSPSLANLAYKNSFFMDGGVPTLELQVIAPIQDHNEMNINILNVIERLKENVEYTRLSKLAYNREPDGFVLTRAISAFERTLISGNSLYDEYINGKLDAFSPSQIRGKNLFFSSKTNCSTCHSGFNFTNNTFESIGLYPSYSDSGRMRVTLNESDRNKFIVPSLRNVEVTAPYMHDGSIQTLEEVVDFFDNGGHNSVNKSSLVRKLYLTDTEKGDLVIFLKSLTDTDFLNNTNHSL
ncbi:MAG: cytochrome-c peroxidase [Flavobacteriales bacterium]